MLQLVNQTPFHPLLSVLPDRSGVDTLFVIVRATFSLDGSSRPADVQPPPVLSDEHFGEPSRSSLRYASDLHLGKPGTDVALLGHARSPEARPVDSLLVALSVAGRRKMARVFGDRTWAVEGGFTEPEPFTALPLVWERAFGGTHSLESGEILAEEQNPVGLGFPGRRSSWDVLGTPLPNIENPLERLSRFGDTPTPVGFGFISPAWRPRRDFVGTYDHAWRQNRAPYLPDDFDPRFFFAAPPDLVFAPALRGGEPIEVIGVDAERVLSFAVPAWELRASVRVAGRLEQPPFALETVLIEPDERRVGLIFRAALPCGKQPLRVEGALVEGRPQARERDHARSIV